MRYFRLSGVFAIVLAFPILLSACGSSGSTSMNRTGEAASTRSTDDLESLYWQKKEESRTYTQADVMFMTGMITHHAQALIMCDLAPKNGASPAVQTLCSRIINSQSDEIKTMQNWLRQRGQPVPEVVLSGLKVGIEGVPNPILFMSGMLTDEQMQELAAARGREWDRLFLTGMIMHHTGAVNMVTELFKKDGAGQDPATFKLASDINVDQRTEIARMELMLNGLVDASR
jgi:uncharacterized protein (DUF305 family)